MNTQNYRFLNLHISIWAKYLITGILFGLLLFAIFGLPIWVVPGITVIILIGVLLTHSGSVSIHYGLKNSNIVINSAWKSITLESPVQADVWWNYTFTSQSTGIIDLYDGSGAMPSRTDDINVMLELQDKNGQKVTFVEKIVFDFRFPNEANYSQETIDEASPIFKVQRVDKLLDFLEKHIAEND